MAKDGNLKTLVNSEQSVLGAIEDTYCLLQNYRMALDEHAIVAITDEKGVITYVNDLFCKLSKYSREELIGQTHSIINSKHHSKQFFSDLWKTISSGTSWAGVICNQAKDGSLYWVKTTIFPFKDRKDKIISYVSVRTDITELIETHYDLQLTKKLLEEEKETLKSKSAALNELFNHLNEEKIKILSTIASNLDFSVFPLLDRLLEQDSSVKKQLEILKKNLKEIADPIIRKAQNASELLTPKELQLCNLIRQGMTVKEIAAIMHLSPRTIDKHRENIRKKLNITERKVNLGAYLSNNLR